MNTMAAGVVAILTNIFSSASKLVFLLIAITLCVGLFVGKITQDNFIYLAASVFSYYFGLSVGSTTTVTPSAPPHAENVPAAPPPVTTSETTTRTTAPATVPGIK